MPNRTLSTLTDCQDFLTGLKLLGTGGGGSPASGLEMLQAALDEGLTLRWIDLADLPDDVYSCTPFGSGSIAAGVPRTEAEVTALGKKLGLENKYGNRAPEQAVRELEAYTGQKIGALVPVELGAANTPSPLVTGARLGLPVVDGDYSGRAVPQDMQTTYFLEGVPTYPAAIVDWWGDVILLKNAANAEMGERIGKMISTASHGVVYIAAIPLNAADTRRLVVPGTLTLSLELGQTVRAALETGKDPIQAAVERIGGWHFFSGVVREKEWENKDGVMIGTTHIDGTGSWSGHTLDVWFLNENHVSWLDGRPHVVSPDLIILADPATGQGYTNTELKAGDAVAALGAKVYPAFRSPKALQYFAPRYWGFDHDYTPIEEVLAA